MATATKKTTTKKTTTKKIATEKTATKKTATKNLDGKALAAKRKPRDSVAQLIKDELTAGKADVDKIIDRALADFPKSKVTRGYVRWIAKGMGLSEQVVPQSGAKPTAKGKTSKLSAKKAGTSPVKKTAKKSAVAPDAQPDISSAEPDLAS